ncbi:MULTISPECIES: DJ-1/PfpI family protein [Salinibaculum]|uniref:DJ-1/PfpI family protein n=1 Tax=Salinibaculum TaxID=2732368 RepID=UPI0030D0E4F2
MTAISRAAVLLFEGFESLDAFGPYEVLAVGANAGPDYDVSLVTAEPAESVTSAHGATVVPDATVAEANPDLLVVPGGGWNDDAARGTRAEADRGVVPELLADLAPTTTIAGVCTGGMLLARAGLLDGRPAVTHAGAMDDLRATDADVVEARVADAGDVLTCGGVTSGIDLALYVLAREFGLEVAAAVEETIEHERHADVHVAD